MPDLSTDIVSLLEYLAPGFLVAWIYHAFTAHEKPSQFERLVSAVLFTVIVHMLVAAEQWVAITAGHLVVFGSWNQASARAAALISATLLGFLCVFVANRDLLHAALRKFGATARSAHPCEWFGVFASHPSYVSLQLKDGSRIFGWPEVWPSDPGRGHFFITHLSRVNDCAREALPHLQGVLINVTDVSHVEFLATQWMNTHDQSRTDEAQIRPVPVHQHESAARPPLP